jgi:hypothetical protein
VLCFRPQGQSIVPCQQSQRPVVDGHCGEGAFWKSCRAREDCCRDFASVCIELIEVEEVNHHDSCVLSFIAAGDVVHSECVSEVTLQESGRSQDGQECKRRNGNWIRIVTTVIQRNSRSIRLRPAEKCTSSTPWRGCLFPNSVSRGEPRIRQGTEVCPS